MLARKHQTSGVYTERTWADGTDFGISDGAIWEGTSMLHHSGTDRNDTAFIPSYLLHSRSCIARTCFSVSTGAPLLHFGLTDFFSVTDEFLLAHRTTSLSVPIAPNIKAFDSP
jgi:hypothetical protein